MRRLAVALAILVAGATLAQAHSFLGPRWAPGTTITMRLQLGAANGRLLDGSADWDASVEQALSLWTAQVRQVSFRAVRGTGPASLGNGINDVTWSTTIYGRSFDDALAVAPYQYRVGGTELSEGDVIFNTAYQWNAYRGPMQANGAEWVFDLRRVALHEFGHTLGLDHPDQYGQTVTAIMNSGRSFAHHDTDALQPDDINGGRALYGGPRVSDTLSLNGQLTRDQYLASANGRYRLVYQGDGNLVLYDDDERSAPWATHTGGTTSGRVVMQGDGNLVLYDGTGRPRWATNTTGTNAQLVVQGDGNVVMYANGQPIWDRYR